MPGAAQMRNPKCGINEMSFVLLLAPPAWGPLARPAIDKAGAWAGTPVTRTAISIAMEFRFERLIGD